MDREKDYDCSQRLARGPLAEFVSKTLFCMLKVFEHWPSFALAWPSQLAPSSNFHCET